MNRRMHIVIRGAVQGVGFRPFIHRLATGLHLKGWVRNSPEGVFIEVEGPEEVLYRFLARITRERPPRSFIQSLEHAVLDPEGFRTFEIRESEPGGEPGTVVLPDIATCPDCLAEILDPANRRYGYPFTNCTNCGPRFTIIEQLPYDRAGTSMRTFTMCAACEAEYRDPADRRFHAQPTACPVCGPHLELWDQHATVQAARGDALAQAAAAVREGRIVAVKGIGGFHLLADARSENAVARLRERKRREEKPLAVMVPDLGTARALCDLSHLEERILVSPEAPIVLARKRQADRRAGGRVRAAAVAEAVAPGNPCLGVMLPYAPLHHLLMRAIGGPVVATSGNLTDEPICIDEQEALTRLCGIADLFLVHDRPIVRHVDDSIVRVIAGRMTIMRRARGFAPLPVKLPHPLPDMLAVGAHLKSTVAAVRRDNVFISQHLGDLETEQSFDAFRAAARDMQALYQLRPVRILADLHPDYLSTQYARNTGIPVTGVQHHYAHVTACMADNALEGELLGVSWDGTGLGTDGTIWGGEFLVTTPGGFTRAATLRTFRLPGGQAAIREPRRTAIGLLYELWGESLFTRSDLLPLRSFPPPKLALLRQVLAQGVNAPETSSIGRLFDAVAALTGLQQTVTFEGQAAMALEWAATGVRTKAEYDVELLEARPRSDAADLPAGLFINWAPMIETIVKEVRSRVPVTSIAARFHNTLAAVIVAVARRVGLPRVVLAGGCFQNKVLTEGAIRRLEQAGYRPYWHQRVPPNDGGITLGQLAAAARELPPCGTSVNPQET